MNPADLPEQQARRQIDAMLVAAGWDVQDRAMMNLAAAPGVAIREFQTKAGPADYLLFLRNQLVGVIEAKRAGVSLSSVEAQTRAYAANAPEQLQVPVRPLPFLDESTGAETWFTKAPSSTTSPQPQTRKLWVYDLRTNLHFTLKTNPMKRADLDAFVDLYKPGALHDRAPTWTEATPEGRWRAYTYDDLINRDKCSLDLFWLKDDSLLDAENLPEPDVIAAEIADDLRSALEQIEEVLGELG